MSKCTSKKKFFPQQHIETQINLEINLDHFWSLMLNSTLVNSQVLKILSQSFLLPQYFFFHSNSVKYCGYEYTTNKDTYKAQLKSNIKITNQNDRKDRQGLIAKGVLVADVITEIFEVSEFTMSAEVFINITNASEDDVDVVAWITSDLTPSKQVLLESNIPLEGPLTYVRGPITMSTGEKLFLSATTDDVVYRIYGYDNRKL